MEKKVLFYLYDFDDEPLGIIYLSTILKANGFIVDIILTKYEDYKQKTIDFKPDVAAFTVTTGFDNYYKQIFSDIKSINKDILIIVGGPHCTFFPEFIEDDKNIDILCRGEGEFAFLELMNCLKDNSFRTNISNLYIRQNDSIIKNEVSPLLNNLDELPTPDRFLLNKYKFYRLSPKKDFITGRGCPFNCSYCFNHVFNKLYKGKGNVIRKHSVDYVLKEIKKLKSEARIDFIQFVDDIFIISDNWLKEFSEKYPYHFNIPFNCNIRVDYVNSKTINLLKKAGCHSVSMGIEAGDTWTRKNILKRNLSNKQIIEACKIIKSHGLKLATQNIVGVPGSNLENDFKTMRLNNICKTDYAWCTIYQPYPGVELTNLAIKLNLFDGDRNKLSNSFHKDSILNIPDKTEVINLHKLFGIGSEYRFLEGLIKIIIKIKILTPILSILRKMWNVYCLKYRITRNMKLKDIFLRIRKKTFV